MLYVVAPAALGPPECGRGILKLFELFRSWGNFAISIALCPFTCADCSE